MMLADMQILSSVAAADPVLRGLELGIAYSFLESVCLGGVADAEGERLGIGPAAVERLSKMQVCFSEKAPGSPLTAIKVAEHETPSSLRNVPRDPRLNPMKYKEEFCRYMARKAEIEKDYATLVCLRYVVFPLLAEQSAPNVASVFRWIETHGGEESGRAGDILKSGTFTAEILQRALRAVRGEHGTGVCGKEYSAYSSIMETQPNCTLGNFRKCQKQKSARVKSSMNTLSAADQEIVLAENLANNARSLFRRISGP